MPSRKISNASIAEAAYHIWLSEGCPTGRDQDHWRQAQEAVALTSRKQRRRAPPAEQANPAEV